MGMQQIRIRLSITLHAHFLSCYTNSLGRHIDVTARTGIKDIRGTSMMEG